MIFCFINLYKNLSGIFNFGQYGETALSVSYFMWRSKRIACSFWRNLVMSQKYINYV